LSGLKCFDAGCGSGATLRQVVQWGGRPEDQCGQDSSSAAVDYCVAHAAQIRVHCASVESVPEPDESFDVAFAFGLYGVVPDEDAAQAIAHELFRVTRPGGLILVYDAHRGRGHSVTDDDIRRWFPSCPLRVHRLTLMQPLAQLCGRWAPALYGPLALVPPLRSHSLWVLRRPALPLERNAPAD
jgi:SAM-dependent methyltransferase